MKKQTKPTQTELEVYFEASEILKKAIIDDEGYLRDDLEVLVWDDLEDKGIHAVGYKFYGTKKEQEQSFWQAKSVWFSYWRNFFKLSYQFYDNGNGYLIFTINDLKAYKRHFKKTLPVMKAA
ncbi:hypothetical protein [Cesiribacter sp. SM1]|uniref:hypothetical protein n=1 Tax=Cesiribacter sp. SM1 TaxID=2861196 RepID=UPI001CD55B3B|nr:hypothetical protein [Cesiribacter sp. SM1]